LWTKAAELEVKRLEELGKQWEREDLALKEACVFFVSWLALRNVFSFTFCDGPWTQIKAADRDVAENEKLAKVLIAERQIDEQQRKEADEAAEEERMFQEFKRQEEERLLEEEKQRQKLLLEEEMQRQELLKQQQAEANRQKKLLELQAKAKAEVQQEFLKKRKQEEDQAAQAKAQLAAKRKIEEQELAKAKVDTPNVAPAAAAEPSSGLKRKLSEKELEQRRELIAAEVKRRLLSRYLGHDTAVLDKLKAAASKIEQQEPNLIASGMPSAASKSDPEASTTASDEIDSKTTITSAKVVAFCCCSIAKPEFNSNFRLSVFFWQASSSFASPAPSSVGKSALVNLLKVTLCVNVLFEDLQHFSPILL
jgi:hypothetical protein